MHGGGDSGRQTTRVLDHPKENVMVIKNRRSTVEVTLIDMEKVMADEFIEAKNDGVPPDVAIGMQPHGQKWGYVETPKGIYVLNEDACSPNGDENALTEEGNIIGLPIFWIRSDEKSSMFPDATVELSMEEVRSWPTLGTENFGKFVRTFGHRLESNFSSWNRFLEGEMAEAV